MNMEVNSFKCKIAGALAGGVLGTGHFIPTDLLSHPTPPPAPKGTKGCGSAALPLQGRHWLPTSRRKEDGACHFRAKCHSALSLTRAGCLSGVRWGRKGRERGIGRGEWQLGEGQPKSLALKIFLQAGFSTH